MPLLPPAVSGARIARPLRTPAGTSCSDSATASRRALQPRYRIAVRRFQLIRRHRCGDLTAVVATSQSACKSRPTAKKSARADFFLVFAPPTAPAARPSRSIAQPARAIMRNDYDFNISARCPSPSLPLFGFPLRQPPCNLTVSRKPE